MKVYIVYTINGDDEVLFSDEAFHSEEAARKYINDTYTVPRRYDWSIQKLEVPDPVIVNPVKCRSCGSIVSHARYHRPKR